MIKLIIYIRKWYSDSIINIFFNSLFDNIDFKKYLIYLVTEKENDIIKEYQKSLKIHKYYFVNNIKNGIKNSIIDNIDYSEKKYTILLNGNLFYIKHNALDILTQTIKKSHYNIINGNIILQNGELKHNEENIKFIDLNICIFKNSQSNLFTNFSYNNGIEKVGQDVYCDNEAVFIESFEYQPRILLDNKNLYFKPIESSIYNNFPIKILDCQSKIKNIIPNIKTKKTTLQIKENIQKHQKHEIIHLPKTIEYMDINKIYIYSYDNNIINNLKSKLNNINIDIEIIDKIRINSYNFYNSIFINLTDDYMSTFLIASTCSKCALITINSKNNCQYFKENYNSIIVDINDNNVYDKILLNINNLRNKNYFNKISKNLYDSYIKHKNYFAEDDIKINKKIKIDRNIFRPFSDKKLINQFQIGIIYNEEENKIQEYINKIKLNDNRMKFGLLSDNIKNNFIFYYEKNYNLYKKSICSLIFDSKNLDIEYEALSSIACGCLPIIITDKKEFELLRRDICFIIDNNDEKTLLHVIKSIINDKNKIKNIIEKGYSYLSLIME